MASGILRELKRYAVIALAIVILQGFISSFIGKYLTFLSGLGSVQGYILSFLAILIILIPAEMITQRTM